MLTTDYWLLTTNKMATETKKQDRSQLRTLRGVVESAKANKTIKVKLEYQQKHQKYGKYLLRRSFLHVHDEKSEAQAGDLVEFAECRPMSKTKHHRLLRVVERQGAPVKAEEPSDLKV